MEINSTSESEILVKHGRIFGDIFLQELDSWFSSDIACCDNCYDQFIDFWPLAYDANDHEFQRSGINIDCLYSGSKYLQEYFTKEEYKVLVNTISCPRCGSTIKANIWAYDLPFAADIDIFEFELNIETITSLSSQTPFLLLTNSFAQSTLKLLHDLSKTVKPTILNEYFYRARTSTQIQHLNKSEFTVAPKEVIQEGRYNHAGEQVLYLASDLETAFYEVNQKLCYIAECKINNELKILDLCQADQSHSDYADDLNALIFSALMSKKLSTTGWDRPVYVFSRFIADCAKAAKFDAIKYPSTKSIGHNFNLAIINKNIPDNHLDFYNLYLHNGVAQFKLDFNI